MKLFLDTEFNGFGGDLISMALVGEDGECFYEVAALPAKPEEFVAEHVLPKLEKEPVSYAEFMAGLHVFLSRAIRVDGTLEVIADWPADFEHLCAKMSAIGKQIGWTLPFECSMRLVRGDVTITPVNPHNALSDALALHDWYMRQSK